LYVVSNCLCYGFHDDDKSWHLPKTDNKKRCHITTQTFLYQSLVYGEIKVKADKPAFK